MKTIISKIEEKLGLPGRMISGSKSGYRNRYPNNFVIFNANIFVDSEKHIGKVWYGDIDLTKEHNILKEISKELKVNLYVLSEMDGRFDNKNNKNFKEDALWDTKSGLVEYYMEYVDNDSLKLII